MEELKYADTLRRAREYLKDAANHTPVLARGASIAYYMADVACASEVDKVVRGNTLYAVEKAAQYFEANARVIDILLSAISHIEMKLWMMRAELSP